MKRNLSQLGWNKELQEAFDGLETRQWQPARIARENRGEYIGLSQEGEVRLRLPGSYLAYTHENSLYPIIGDWVAIEGGIIRRVLPRRGVFQRQEAGARSTMQRIAAHIDFAFLVVGLDNDFNPKRIERYLALARSSTIEPVIVLNKADLCQDIEERLATLASLSEQAPIHAISALNQKGVERLKDYLTMGKTIALLGSSGAGKSTLINALLGSETLKTGGVRESDSRGRHTTTWREMILLPQGAVILDTPGMREIQLFGDDEGLRKSFEDIERLAAQCRFRNCSHAGEPGCAINQALRDGTLDLDRFNSFQKLKAENKGKRERLHKVDTSMEKSLKKKKKAFFKSISVAKRKAEKQRRKISRSRDGDFGYK